MNTVYVLFEHSGEYEDYRKDIVGIYKSELAVDKEKNRLELKDESYKDEEYYEPKWYSVEVYGIEG